MESTVDVINDILRELEKHADEEEKQIENEEEPSPVKAVDPLNPAECNEKPEEAETEKKAHEKPEVGDTQAE